MGGLFLHHFDPLALPRTGHDGIAKDQFLMPGFERGKAAPGLEIASFDVRIKILEEPRESVRIAFGVATRINRICSRSWTHERRIFWHDLIRLRAMPEPQRVRLF